MANDNLQNEENKDSLLLKIIGMFIATLFPIFKMFSLNSKLKILEQTIGSEIKDRKTGKYVSPYSWIPKQKKKNLLFGILSIFPFLFSLMISYQVLSTNEIFIKGITAAKKEISRFRIIEAKKKMEIANKIDNSVYSDIEVSFYIILIGLGISSFSGLILNNYHPLLTDTKKFKKLLVQSGFIKKEEADDTLVFATPIGFLIDITGNTPREIADSDRIWIPLNVRVNRDWSENPNKRSIVFFKKAYELKKGDEYGFNKLPKEK